MEKIIVPGSESKKLAEKVAKNSNLKICKTELRRFPDNEIYLRILTDVKGRHCIVIQSTPTSDAFLELIFILDTLKDLGAETINAIIPYIGYSRQDKRFLPGEAISIKTILGVISEKADRITTVNAHFLSKFPNEYESLKIKNLTAFPLIAKYFKKKLKRPVLIAPDKGALRYVKEAASVLNCKFGYFEKKRISSEEVEMKIEDIDVSGKDAVILDDIISTGGTMLKAIEILKNENANTINVGCVHAVLLKGIEKVAKFADEVICTDSIFREKFSKVSLAKIISENL